MNEERMRELKRIVQVIIKFLKKFGPIITTAIASIVSFFLGYLANEEQIENFITARWGKPDITYSSENKIDFFKSDIKLKDGILGVYPQLLIQQQEDGAIIRMLALKDYYRKNELKYSADIEGFQVEVVAWDELKRLIDEIERILNEEGKEIDFHFVVLMKLDYKNLKKNDYATKYYLMQEEKVKSISEDEVEERGEDYPIYLDKWNEYVDTIIKDCLSAKPKNSS